MLKKGNMKKNLKEKSPILKIRHTYDLLQFKEKWKI